MRWFYGRLRGGSFQRTLELTANAGGHRAPSRCACAGMTTTGAECAIEGADVFTSGASAVTDKSGAALLRLPPGTYVVRASKRGLIPSFGERVTVR